MSGFFDSARSPGVIGVVLGLLVLVAFGGLSMAVFDGRLNGDNAAALKNEVTEQAVTIMSLEDEIERAEAKIVEQKRNEAVSEKLALASKTYETLAEKEKSLRAEIEEVKKEVTQAGEDKLAYRDEYRVYERQRAVGEKFDEVELSNGKVIKDVTIKEILTDRIRFTTSFGSSSATWEELPQQWRDRFQIGEGELEEYNRMLTESRKKRMAAISELQGQRSEELKLWELKKRISRIGDAISKKRVEMEQARAKAAMLRSKAGDLRARASNSRQRGSSSSYSNSARKADEAAEKLNAGIRITSQNIRELKQEKTRLERQLRDLQR